MTSRQQRRAEERKARKQAVRNSTSQLSPRQAGSVPAHCPPPVPANQPTPEYAAMVESSTFAMLLPAEQAGPYRAHLLAFLEQYAPVSGVETEIVKRLADLRWRLMRTAMLEAGIMSLGRRNYAELFTETDPTVRNALLDAHTLAVDGLVLRRLHTQEARLRRFYASDLAELTAMQAARTAAQPDVAEQPSLPLQVALPADDGFEFSTCFQPAIPEEPAAEFSLYSILDPDLADDFVSNEFALA